MSGFSRVERLPCWDEFRRQCSKKGWVGVEWGGTVASIYFNSVSDKKQGIQTRFKQWISHMHTARKFFNTAKLEQFPLCGFWITNPETVSEWLFSQGPKTDPGHITHHRLTLFNCSFCCFSSQAVSMPACSPFVFFQLHPGTHVFRCVHYLYFSCLLSS